MAEHDRHTGHHHNGGHGDMPDSVTEGMRGDVPSKDPVCGMTVDPATRPRIVPGITGGSTISARRAARRNLKPIPNGT